MDESTFGSDAALALQQPTLERTAGRSSRGRPSRGWRRRNRPLRLRSEPSSPANLPPGRGWAARRARAAPPADATAAAARLRKAAASSAERAV